MAWFKKKNEDVSFTPKLGDSQREETPIESEEERKEMARRCFVEALNHTIRFRNDLAKEAIGKTLRYFRDLAKTSSNSVMRTDNFGF